MTWVANSFVVRAAAMSLAVRSLFVFAAVAVVCTSSSCRKPAQPLPPDRAAIVPEASTPEAQDATTATPAPTADSSDAGSPQADAVQADSGATGALTIRIVNTASRAVPFYTNPDINEMIHTRKLRSRRGREDGGRDSDPVKFFAVGQMPLCAGDGGAGYGGLGQPERRELAPGEVMEFVWDGLERREVLDRARGVCLEVGPPQPGRYRFEIDQPHRTLRCEDVEFSYPLREGAPRVLEMRCRIRTSSDDHGSGDEG